VPLAPLTRCYFLAGVQHFPRSSWIDKAAGARYLINPVDHRPVQRALLAALEAWVADGIEPPPSVYPKLALGQLTGREGLKFPAIDGVDVPRYPRPARRLNFGPDFASHGIISQEPPKIEGAYPVLVPQVDADGIDLGGIRLPQVAVPVATITGWNLRAEGRGAPNQIAEFYGSILPFARTKAERDKSHDPRLSVAERYAGRDEYMKHVNAAADDLIARRFLLPQDKSFAVEAAANLFDHLKQ